MPCVLTTLLRINHDQVEFHYEWVMKYKNVTTVTLPADTVAEWLRRHIRNLLEFLRAGSSPVGVGFVWRMYPLCISETSWLRNLVTPYPITLLQYTTVVIYTQFSLDYAIFKIVDYRHDLASTPKKRRSADTVASCKMLTSSIHCDTMRAIFPSCSGVKTTIPVWREVIQHKYHAVCVANTGSYW